jgi:hypothetical protein
MVEKQKKPPSEESIRKAMELAWRDHHHARDQTWKTVQIVAILGAGLLTIDFKYENFVATVCAAILVIIAAAFGALITWNHRKLERRKFIHLMNCEEVLGLHRDDLIPLHPGNDSIKSKDLLVQDSAVKVPEKFRLLDIVNPFKQNTALFILRMHLAIMIFAILIVALRHNIG